MGIRSYICAIIFIVKNVEKTHFYILVLKSVEFYGVFGVLFDQITDDFI